MLGGLICRGERRGGAGWPPRGYPAMDDAPASTGCLVNREQGGDWGWAGPALWPLGPSAAVAVPLPLSFSRTFLFSAFSFNMHCLYLTKPSNDFCKIWNLVQNCCCIFRHHHKKFERYLNSFEIFSK